MWIAHTCSFKYWKCRRGIADKDFVLEDAAESEEKRIPLIRSRQAA